MQSDPNHEDGGSHAEEDPLYHSITGRNNYEEKLSSGFIGFLSLLLLNSIKNCMIQTFFTVIVLLILYLLQLIIPILVLPLFFVYFVVISPLLILDELKIRVFENKIGVALFTIPIPNYTGILLLLSLYLIMHLTICLFALAAERSHEK